MLKTALGLSARELANRLWLAGLLGVLVGLGVGAALGPQALAAAAFALLAVGTALLVAASRVRTAKPAGTPAPEHGSRPSPAAGGEGAPTTAPIADDDERIREIHHRVKNLLQVIASLLSLQRRVGGDAAKDKDGGGGLADMRLRVGVIGRLYGALYADPAASDVSVGDVLDAVVAEAAGSMGEPPPTIGVRSDLLRIDRDRATPVALFVLEALLEARGDPAGPAAALSVDLTVGPREATLEVRGTGGAPRARTTGGLSALLLPAYARQLDGQVVSDTGPSGEVRIRLTLPPDGGPAPVGAAVV